MAAAYRWKVVEGQNPAQLTDDEKETLGDQLEAKTTASLQRFYKTVVPLTVGLAPSSAAAEPARRANEEVTRLDVQFPTGNFISASRDEVDRIDKVSDEILRELKSLPQLTPDQVKALYSTLPPEELVR